MHFCAYRDNNAHTKSNPIMAIVNVKEVYSSVFNFAIVKAEKRNYTFQKSETAQFHQVITLF